MGIFDDLVAEADEKLRRIEEVQHLFERTEVTGHSRNNGVTARMRGSGQIVEVVIDPRILQRFDAKAIGSFVTEAVNDAMHRLHAANEALWAPIMTEVDTGTPS